MAKAIPYPTTYYHLRLMDSYLLDQWDTLNDESTPNSSAEIDRAKRNDDEMDNAREEWLMDDLGALGVCIELATRDDDDDFCMSTPTCSVGLQLTTITYQSRHASTWTQPFVYLSLLPIRISSGVRRRFTQIILWASC